MTTTTFGSGIAPVEAPEPEASKESPSVLPLAEFNPATTSLSDGIDLNGLIETVRASVRGEMDAAVADIERRHAQAREMELAALTGVPRSTVHTEDLNIGKHLIDGYTVTANSPTNGSIAWSSLHVVLLGVDYTISNGNTPNKYAWFIKPASGTTATLQTGNTLPVLSPVDALIFVNDGGVPISALETSISYAVGPGVIGNEQLAASVQQTLSTLSSNDIALQAAIDGSITSFYQDNPPWPNGSPSPSGGNVNQGDVWYDSNDGGAFRWTGSSGSPANTWQRIADTDVASVAALAGTKTTTYVTTPVAPAGGFTVGDLWIDAAANNALKRWSGSAWVLLQLGDAAIASGISGAKIGSGINASNITTGTVNGTLVGTGINGTNVTTGTVGGARIGAGVAPSVLTGAGTAPVAAIPTLNPDKLNTSFHMIY